MVSYFKNSLKSEGHVHAINNTLTYALTLADYYAIAPNIYDSGYVDFLLSYCCKYDIKAIIPLFDIDLPILSKNNAAFQSKGIKVIVSDFEVTQICNDKWQTQLFLRDHGIKYPKTFLSVEDCLEQINTGAAKYPFMIKPRWGMGSIAVYKAENVEELWVLFKKSKIDALKTYLKYESISDINNCILIQEFLEGEEYGIDVFNDFEGEYVTCVPMLKLSMRAGETDIAEIIESQNLVALGRKLSDSLKHIGILDVDVIYNAGQPYVIDINCRFGGQYPFCHLGGVNFSKAIIDLLKIGSIDPQDLNIKYGTVTIKDIVPKPLYFHS